MKPYKDFAMSFRRCEKGWTAIDVRTWLGIRVTRNSGTWGTGGASRPRYYYLLLFTTCRRPT